MTHDAEKLPRCPHCDAVLFSFLEMRDETPMRVTCPNGTCAGGKIDGQGDTFRLAVDDWQRKAKE